MKDLHPWVVITSNQWLFVIIWKEEEGYRCVKISNWWIDNLSYEEVLTEEITWYIEK